MGYSKLIQNQINTFQGWIDDAKKREFAGRFIEKIEAAFPEGHYSSGGITDLTIQYRLDNIGTMERMLRWMRGFGYMPTSVKDDPRNKCKTFTMVGRDSTLDEWNKKNYGDFQFAAYFMNDDASCKYVEVGREDVPAIPAIPARPATTVPILELRCDEPEVV